jgi:pimeloyl-ACP methyl ester carboxylesterase
MQKNFWTTSKARLTSIKTTPGAHFNWLFLPGGPGMGSESLAPLTNLLALPGTIWHLDLPGDGSNITSDDTEYFSHWSQALVEACSALEHVILVAHSTGGMYALSTPELEKNLSGLVLMDSAPDASWQKLFGEIMQQEPIPGVDTIYAEYSKNPNNKILKQLTLLNIPYLFTKNGLKKDISFLEDLPYNFRSCEWSAQNFDQDYKATWVPQKLPTLIFAGTEDKITPLYLFQNSKEFQRENIKIVEITNAGHFPWIENPAEVIHAFNEYCDLIRK